tara:strand:+ start:3026 stop:3745 length:720 start_codon:yes stop_codon:yes gene_type:complete
MARIIFLLGDEGTGKTSSFNSLPPQETVILRANRKPLPWQGFKRDYQDGANLMSTKDLGSIEPTISHVSESMPHIKYLVIDDYFHLTSAVVFSPEFLAKTDGGEAFQRYTELAAQIYHSLFQKEFDWREDLNIIVTNHTQTNDSGQEVFKTPGNLVEKDIKPASLVTYVLHSCVIPQQDGTYRYAFQTNRTSSKMAKTPRGMFDQLYIPNDMLAVINRIDEYDLADALPVVAQAPISTQ